MKRQFVVGLVPPLVVIAVVLLLVPARLFSTGVIIALAFLGLFYIVLVTFPIIAPRSDGGLLFGASYSRLVWPSLGLATIVTILSLLLQSISWKWFLAGDISILGFLVVSAAVTSSLSERDAKLNSEAKGNISDFRSWAMHVEDVGRGCIDPTLRKRAVQLAEQIRLSPFKGVIESRAIESEIESAVCGLDASLDLGELSQSLEGISKLVARRNEMVKSQR